MMCKLILVEINKQHFKYLHFTDNLNAMIDKKNIIQFHSLDKM